ncbi:MAG TPA: enolase C-terminal domain-like protein [Pirellulales bacterium]|jgi:L-alanine-DL-glutamate epimerase-like enolase superfamily enzyme|nr:enolase C-terminal domain-like protein [Pirellulales bacterium]
MATTQIESPVDSIEEVEVAAYRIPTDFPESDGTLCWDATVLVVVRLQAGNHRGLGFGYADKATATLIHDKLAPLVRGTDPLSIPATRCRLAEAIRNLGRPGIAAMAISIVDIALWDLKARLLGLPLVDLLGAARDAVPVYGSGGFTSYSDDQLRDQLSGWVEMGIPRVKMKIGRDAVQDLDRVAVARRAIGDAQLFVDANGAYSRKQALAQAHLFADAEVCWFEEPVSSDDLEGLHLLRDRAPAGMDIAAGEYGYDPFYFRRMLDAQAVDVLQADATRCGGVSGFLQVAAQCAARPLRLSGHTAPSIHAHLGCARPEVIHLEYFHDHARIERMLFDGVLQPVQGRLTPDRGRPGLGLDFKVADAERWKI